MSVAKLLFFFFICITADASTDVVELTVLKEPDELKDEKFFRINKGYLLSNIKFTEENRDRWEKLFGPLSREKSNFKQLNLQDLGLEFIKEGLILNYFDSESKKISSYKFSKKVNVCLVENTLDEPKFFYKSFVISLSDSKRNCEDLAYNKFDSVGFAGANFHLDASYIGLEKTEEKSFLPDEIAAIKRYLQKTYNTNEIDKLKYSGFRLGNIIIYHTYSSDEGELGFLRTSKRNLIAWRLPPPDYGAVYRYGKWLQEAELTAILDTKNEQYLLIFQSDRVLKFPISI